MVMRILMLVADLERVADGFLVSAASSSRFTFSPALRADWISVSGWNELSIDGSPDVPSVVFLSGEGLEVVARLPKSSHNPIQLWPLACPWAYRHEDSTGFPILQKHLRIPVHEGIDGIDAVERRVPILSTLAPAAASVASPLRSSVSLVLNGFQASMAATSVGIL